MLPSNEKRLDGAHGDALVYNVVERADSAAPTLVFLPGYRSDRMGGKALHLETIAQRLGWGSVRLDYHAHGDSPGDFLEGCISRWTNNCLDLIDQATTGPLILAGSSMGGWIMVRAALARPDRVKAMLGIAAAPDFTQDLMIPDFTDDERDQLRRQGYIAQPTPYDDDPYLISQTLLDDGAECLVLPTGIPFDGPVSLVHGQQDTDVPLSTALRLMAALSCDDVQLTLIKDGEHRLSRDSDLRAIEVSLIELAARAGFHDTHRTGGA